MMAPQTMGTRNGRAITRETGVAETTTRRIARRYRHGGLAAALNERDRSGPPRVLTPREAALLRQMIDGPPPEGYARWSVRLIAREAVRRAIVTTIGRESVRVFLRQTA